MAGGSLTGYQLSELPPELESWDCWFVAWVVEVTEVVEVVVA